MIIMNLTPIMLDDTAFSAPYISIQTTEVRALSISAFCLM